MHCTRCGTEAAAVTRFCSQCGNALPFEEAKVEPRFPTSAPTPPPAPPAEAPKPVVAPPPTPAPLSPPSAPKRWDVRVLAWATMPILLLGLWWLTIPDPPPANATRPDDGPIENRFTAWSAWRKFGVGSSTTMEGVGSGLQPRAITTLLDRQAASVKLLTVAFVDEVKMSSTERTVLKSKAEAPPEPCEVCKKLHPKVRRRLPDREKLTCKGLDLDCILIESVETDCSGAVKEKVKYWISEDVPGWILKSVSQSEGKEYTQVCTDFTRN